MKRHGLLYVMTALLLILVFCLWAPSAPEEMLSFRIDSGGAIADISLWEAEDGRCYVFLPSYARPEDVRISVHSKAQVSINGIRLEDGMTCEAFAEGTVYGFSYTVLGITGQTEIRFLKSANISTMYIDTESGSMDYIHSEKGNKESGSMALYLPDGTLDHSGQIASIQGRGNVTWTDFAKKPYSLRLSGPADLLHLGSAEKWILLANADDLSQMRNKVIYDFADRVGLSYSPDSAWVDLYLNGEYAGLYLLCERNEVHPERVRIGEAGSFLVSLENRDRIAAQNYPFLETDAGQYLRIHYPEDPSAAQLEEMEGIWQSVENGILAEDDVDPVTGKTWMEQIDLDSWVKKYLVEEIFGNGDACFISQFFYLDGSHGEQKICAGPVWDYDHTMGSEGAWQLMAPNTLYANRYHVKAGFDTPWFSALYQKDVFYDRMKEIYRQEFLPLLKGFLYEYIEACGREISGAYVLNQVRWDISDGDLSVKTEYLQTFMEERIAFLNRIWLEEAPYHMVQADNARGNLYGYLVAFPGEPLTGLPWLADTETWKFLGWYDVQTGKAFHPEEPVSGDVAVQAKWQARPALWLGRIGKVISLPVLMLLLLLLLYLDRKREKTMGTGGGLPINDTGQ